MLPNCVLLCLLSRVSGGMIPDKLFPSELDEKNDVGQVEFDSSIIIERVLDLLGELLNSQKASGKTGFEVSKFFCSGNVTKKYRSCNEKCRELSISRRLLCTIDNFTKYLMACFSDDMECYTVTSATLTDGPKPTDGGGSVGNNCNCDYSTFSSSHTMNKYTGPDQACGAYTKSGVTGDEIKTILKTHNELREKVAIGLETQGSPGPQPGATNMFELTWNCELAEVAQRWAERCKLDHDKGDDRKICNQDYYVGQNVFIQRSFDAASVWEGAINGWYSEVKYMPTSLVGSFGNHPTGEAIGHYTQVVWAGTYEVGCGGIHFPETLDGTTFPESKVYVCNYGAGGNLLGSQIYESGTAASNCPNGLSSDYQGLCAPPS